MPKTTVPSGTPVNVETASAVFCSPLRMHLIRHYLTSPGPQRDAVERLGATQRAVSVNTRALVTAGVLLEEPATDRRFQIYRVDVKRVEQLLAAISAFTLSPQPE